MLSLTSYKNKKLVLKNRIVMPAMCMYKAGENGRVNQFHLSHYGSRSLGGVALIIVEATAVEPNGRISAGDLGIWSDEHIEGMAELVDQCHRNGSKIALQLGHAGRKSEIEGGIKYSPSGLNFSDKYGPGQELSKLGIRNIIGDFKEAARRADRAGFDAIEIHAAHGYLIHQFLSPLTNKRRDSYGSSRENRVRFLREILQEVRSVWPSNKPIILRVSADDYIVNGINIFEMVKIIDMIKHLVDLVHVSSGGLLQADIKTYEGYQVKYARKIKTNCKIDTIAVGLIEDLDKSEEILRNKDADLVAMGRKLLREPNYILNYAYENKLEISYPEAYRRAFE